MFTGIVEELGEIAAVEELADQAARLTVRGPLVTSDAKRGDSIAVNGVCLTVVEQETGTFSADVMRETLRRSSLGALGVGSPVNLERPVTLHARLGGHLVQGHVDGTATILDRQPSEHWELVRCSLPGALSRYVVAKGSITVDGVSLTVVEVSSPPSAVAAPALVGSPAGTVAGMESEDPVPTQAEPDGWFTVSLIPETLGRTTLGRKGIGDLVNLEVDVIAKYVERLMENRT